MELIFIGENYYRKSATTMSSIYTIEGRRVDWGSVKAALKNGKSVHIRPATKKEKMFYSLKLKAGL